jgi:hypothetical protein
MQNTWWLVVTEMVDADNAFYNLEFNKVSTKNRCRYETV